VKIYLGQQTPEHKGDTSRELIDMWEESNYCEVIRDEVNDLFIWANEPNDILLYEYDRHDVYPGLPDQWKAGLFGGMQCSDSRALPWIYWARRPKLLEEKIKRGILGYDDRGTESIFLGKIENSIQQSNRTQDNWFGVIEKFNLPLKLGDSFNWPYTQEEYLDLVSQSRFGLALAGYGPKCNREIEYFGLGVVPIVAKEVDMVYYDPLEEGKHYFRVDNAEEIPKLIASCSQQRWEEMSKAGRDWYEKNCSRLGSFLTTEKIISSL